MSKSELRELALRSRRSIPGDAISRLSLEVKEMLDRLPEYQRAKTLAAYVAKSDEVQTRGIIEGALASGKRVIVPATDPQSVRLRFSEIRSYSELAPGYFGILEPRSEANVPLASSDIVLVPVVAWDERGYRIGYGRGYFDRELREKGRSLSVGLALESQRVRRVPETPSDTPLEVVVTEKRVLRFGRDAS